MPERAVPPIRGLFGDSASRGAAFRYWVSDTARGLLNLSIHNGLRLTSTAFCSAFGASQARFCPMRFPESDARARHLWSVLRPEQSTPAELDAAMRRLWRNVARTMAEYSVVDRLWAEGRIAVEGAAYLKAARDAGGPVVLAGLHLANWETIGAVVAALGYPIASTYEPPENRFDHYIANRVRARYRMRMIYPDRAGGRAAYRAVVRGGEIFTFYVDEIFRGRVSAPAFGRGAKIAGNIGNAVRLARLTDADIIIVYCTRDGDRPRFTVTFTPPLAQARTADERADLAANVAALDRAITPIVKDHLDQWYYALDFDFAPHDA
jgi:KDO2-lipid IV(A) lauroyltransferase